MADFQITSTPKARKAHVCPECGTTIQPGERYARIAGAYDGDFYSAIQCQPCHAFGERFLSSLSLASWLNRDEATYPFGDMIPHAVEHLEFEWEGPSASGQRPAKRDAMMALFDAFDERERAHQAADRAAKKNAARRQSALRASRQMIRGMSMCAVPAPSLSAGESGR